MTFYPTLMEMNAVNEIWPELIQRAIEPPQTITETVDRLFTVLDEEHKVAIAAMPQEELTNLHFSLGLAIRNAFEFWDSKSPLLNSSKPMHLDEISDQIIHELWQRLSQTSEYRTLNDTIS
jgi:hypothetical protein